MPDREKVIKGLEQIVNDPFMKARADYWVLVCSEAIVLLKEQEAAKPRVSTAEQRCGNCNKVIEMDGWITCPWCGKRIDWESWWSKNGH